MAIERHINLAFSQLTETQDRYVDKFVFPSTEYLFTTFATRLLPTKSRQAKIKKLKHEHAIFRLSSHIQRILNGANNLPLLRCHSSEITEKLIARCLCNFLQNAVENQLRETSPLLVRIILTEDQLIFTAEHYLNPWILSDEISLCSTTLTREMPEIKSSLNKTSIAARKIAAGKNCSEALLVSSINTITEGAWSNFFWLDEHYNLHTPSKEILHGVTREAIIELTSPSFTNISIKTLLASAKGAFLTQSTAGVTAVHKIDNTVFTDDKAQTIISQINSKFLKHSERELHFIFDT